jgi:hypothetical protein
METSASVDKAIQNDDDDTTLIKEESEVTPECAHSVQEWFSLEQKIKDNQELIKMWKKEQKELVPSIKGWMKKRNVKAISTKLGTIQLEVNEKIIKQKDKKT